MGKFGRTLPILKLGTSVPALHLRKALAFIELPDLSKAGTCGFQHMHPLFAKPEVFGSSGSGRGLTNLRARHHEVASATSSSGRGAQKFGFNGVAPFGTRKTLTPQITPSPANQVEKKCRVATRKPSPEEGKKRGPIWNQKICFLRLPHQTITQSALDEQPYGEPIDESQRV